MPTATQSEYRRHQGRTQRQEYETLRSSLMSDRSSFDAHWRELADYIQPRRSRFFVTDRNRGDRRNQKIIDATATLAARTLRSGMHAGITSPARPWMRLTTPDPDLAEFATVKEWLHTVTGRMLTVFLRSNLYNALPIIYGDMAIFGTAAMACLEDEHDLLRCYTYPVGSYALGVSSRQVVDTIVREYQMTVWQVVEEFALDRRTNQIDRSKLSMAILNLWDRGEYQASVEVCWVVRPNPDRDDGKMDSKYLPFVSCHFEKGQGAEDKYLRESGFKQFPILAPRWDVTGEDTYGTDCPGMTALGDIKALQIMQKRKAQAVELMINPSLQAPSHLRNQKTSLLPGDISYVDLREAQQGIRAIREVQPAMITPISNDIIETQNMIRRVFYEDLFLMLAQSDRREITAREIDERHEEKLLALGPVLERTNDELLDPLVDRVYGMMDEAGMIPEPPPELQGVDLKVEYISLMAQAQKLVGAAGLDRFMSGVAGLVQLFPEVRHKVNLWQVIDDSGDMLGINPKIIVPDDEASDALAAQRKAAAAVAQAQTMETMGKTAKSLGQAPLEQDSMLKRMVEGGG